MAALLFPELQFNDNLTGSPLAAGRIYTYLAGTTTPAETYTDNTGGTSVGTYVDLDANGRPNNGNGMWLDSTVQYKFVIKDANGTTVQTIDNIISSGFSGSSYFVLAAADANLSGARTLTGSTSVTITDNGAGSTIVAKRAALTGDVTASADSNTTTIANDAVTTAKILDANVTLAKMANIATDSLIGRDTAGTGAPENITLNSTLSMTGAGALQRAALTGDVTASAGSNATTIANDAVTTAKILNNNVTLAKMATQAANTVLGNATSSTAVPAALTLGNGLVMDGTSVLQTQLTVNSQTGTTYTAVAGDRDKEIVFSTQSTATLSLTAAATLGSGWFCRVYNSNSGTLTIDPNSSETIEGTTTLLVPSGMRGLITCTGSAFRFYTHPNYSYDNFAYNIPLTDFGSSTLVQCAGVQASPVSPTQLTADTNNLIVKGTVALLTASAAWNLTGLQMSYQGQIVFLVNTSAFTITLKHNSASSFGANRFYFDTGADISLLANQTLCVLATAPGKWRNVI